MSSVSFETHFDFSALPLVQVREAFSRIENGQKAVYAGVQHTSWARDEAIWNSRDGRFGGATSVEFFRAVPDEIRIEDAEIENLSQSGLETDVIARLPVGTSLRAGCGVQYQDAASAHFRLYDSGGGYLERVRMSADISPSFSADFGILAPGSYALWLRLGGVFDVDLQVASPTEYEILWGEWALLRVQIGAGAWEISPEVLASPGCPLYRKAQGMVTLNTQNEAQYRVMFDLAARSVSASCVLEQDILHNDGSVDVPNGSQIIAGLRASRSGPQSAIWALNEDGSARLLGVSENFSHGVCECGKADHHASDVAQGPDGALYLLSECSLHRYTPNEPKVEERLKSFPTTTEGHPGGQCLRFPGTGQEIAFWTENLTQGVDDGASWYNRLVRRVGGRDQKGVSSWWHGPNCAEVYLGRFWSLRGETPDETVSRAEQVEKATIFLDWLDNGRWHGYTGLQRSAKTHRWQRLRRVGSELWVFGFAPSTTDENENVVTPESPLAAWSDGHTLEEVSFPFFVRRATSCSLNQEPSLFVTATTAVAGIGPASHVVEVYSHKEAGTACSFWNFDENSFVLSRAAWEAMGRSVEELPQYLIWKPQYGRDAGGVWISASTVTSEDVYLERVIETTLIRFAFTGEVILPRTLLLENGIALTIESGANLERERN